MKRVITATRDKLFGGLLHKLDLIGTAQAALELKIEAAEQTLATVQRQINHSQHELLTEILQRGKNSGTMQVSDTELVTKIFSGLKLYVDPRDIAVVPHLVLDGVWEHRITTAWLKVLRANDTIVDIGANFGYFGALAAQQTHKKHSKVIMFEANPHLIPYLKKTVAVNWLNEQSVIENLAIADKPGQVVLHLLKDYIGSSSLQSAEELAAYMGKKMYLETAEEIPVAAVSLDGYCRKHSIKAVDLIKMDIEGYEEKAYQGMREIIAASPAASLFVEFTREGYRQPESFYAQMLHDFGHVYTIGEGGAITRPDSKDYQAVIGDADDWVMPIFSKRSDLAEL